MGGLVKCEQAVDRCSARQHWKRINFFLNKDQTLNSTSLDLKTDRETFSSVKRVKRRTLSVSMNIPAGQASIASTWPAIDYTQQHHIKIMMMKRLPIKRNMKNKQAAESATLQAIILSSLANVLLLILLVTDQTLAQSRHSTRLSSSSRVGDGGGEETGKLMTVYLTSLALTRANGPL